MVDQLNAFAGEVSRVAREVGTEGKLGGQAKVPGVAGTWKDLTDNVNVMAANLTEQVRGIVKVVTAVANGDLKPKLTVNAKGEVAALAETINNMTGTLATFADQVTTVAREVGVEGRLGGQANVPGAAGTWKDLTGNVNLLAANLTSQVRTIAEVATAVTQGDLTRSIQVEARGEVAELKDNINTMINNLRLTTERNNEQDWLKTEPGPVHRHAAGPARPGHRWTHAALRVDPSGERPTRGDLPGRRGRLAGAQVGRRLRRSRRQCPPPDAADGRGAGRSVCG
jgi:HAMP domain-containing protein